MATVIRQTEWVSLIEFSGPFLVPRVLEEVLPQGFETVETPVRHRLREAYDEWREAVDGEDSELDALHQAWTRLVLEECLEYDDRILVSGDDLPGSLSYHMAEHGETIRPDLAVFVADRASIIVPIFVLPPDTDLERSLSGARWPASPLERTTMFCRATGARMSLVTNGERWTLVHVTRDGVSGHASWFARLWWQEPITLQAFRSLLGVRRHFGPDDETLPALLDRSLEYKDEVTDRLGQQVLYAVEVLVQALDRADVDRNGELLQEVTPQVLYEAALTVMMRLVFLLAAEERGLLLLGDPLYDAHYAVSTLRAQLRERADHEGFEVLERRREAWSRLLATFRAVYAGVEHPRLPMPALGGSLFDPDRFPFLEGRPPESLWRETPARPLPIDDRTVLLLLESLQVLEDQSGARLLSYCGLDVEQIGYVYEGLLEHTVVRISESTLGLRGSHKTPNPNITLSELELARVDGETVLVRLLAERTSRSSSALRNDLRRKLDAEPVDRLQFACGNDQELAERIRPFVYLLRADVRGYPLVYPRGAMAVTHGADRRETGTHYTPQSLTKAIVAETLEPLVYVGPAEGRPRDQWTLRPPTELLGIRVCDPAMGSGAFLVQVCRYLSDALVQAWRWQEDEGRVIGMDGLPHAAEDAVEPIPQGEDDRLVMARRLVAERCVYGVDVNPLAVELAKLSIWLVTLSKGRPLEYLDHNLRCGDSLLGIRDLDQLFYLDLDPGPGTSRPLFAQNIERAVEKSLEWRQTIRATPIRDVRDVRDIAEMEKEARRVVEAPKLVADALVGLAFASGGDERKAKAAWKDLSIDVGSFLSGEEAAGRRIERLARQALGSDLPVGKPPRRPFHWPLEFPEVFQRENGGFNAMVGNPPYVFGELRPRVVSQDYSLATGQWDLCWLFVERTFQLLERKHGGIGLLLPDSILAREEPSILRAFVVENADCILLEHFGARFKAGVSVVGLCVSLGNRSAQRLCYQSPDGQISQIPLAQLREKPRRPWTFAESMAYASMTDWRSLEEFILISRGEEAGKKHLRPFVATGSIPVDHIPVVAGAGVVELLRQPMPTHVMPVSMVRKKRSNYSAPKIVAVKTGTTIQAGIDKIGIVTLQSAYNIQLKPTADELTLEFVCAILVSKVANRLFVQPFTEMKKMFPQITQGMIKQVKIPPLRRGLVTAVTEMVQRLFETGDAAILAELNALMEEYYKVGVVRVKSE